MAHQGRLRRPGGRRQPRPQRHPDRWRRCSPVVVSLTAVRLGTCCCSRASTTPTTASRAASSSSSTCSPTVSAQKPTASIQKDARREPGGEGRHASSTRTRPTRSSRSSSPASDPTGSRPSPRILPPSFRVAPGSQDPDVVKALGEQFQTSPASTPRSCSPTRWSRRSRRRSTRSACGSCWRPRCCCSPPPHAHHSAPSRGAMFARRREIEVIEVPSGPRTGSSGCRSSWRASSRPLLGAGRGMGFLDVPHPARSSTSIPGQVLPIFRASPSRTLDLLFTNVLAVIVGGPHRRHRLGGGGGHSSTCRQLGDIDVTSSWHR